MRDLINRLEVTDNATAGALRVIEERASVAAVVRAMATLARCAAGLHDAIPLLSEA
ncbi:hypothetical protein ACFWAN_48475 [Streptomyces mirabilis]|uniref:hypothetical protein n=1 Tax=Streptomyces mirabilis TaxID=68239 RepID=UPI00364C74A9